MELINLTCMLLVEETVVKQNTYDYETLRWVLV